MNRLLNRFRTWRMRRRARRHLQWLRRARVAYDYRDYLSQFKGSHRP